MSRGSSNASTSNSAANLASGLAKVDKMINGGRKLGYTEAAINLENWRDAKGDRIMPAASFQNESFLLKHLKNNHRPQFIKGAKKRLASKALLPGGTTEMQWEDSVNGPPLSDLWFALGGFTVRSRVMVQVLSPSSGPLILRFQYWRFDISDVYDWDAGKSTYIPGVGNVTDDEMLALENAGHGKVFNITSEVATVVDREITGDEVLDG